MVGSSSILNSWDFINNENEFKMPDEILVIRILKRFKLDKWKCEVVSEHAKGAKRDRDGSALVRHIYLHGSLPTECPFLIMKCCLSRRGDADSFTLNGIISVKRFKRLTKKLVRESLLDDSGKKIINTKMIKMLDLVVNTAEEAVPSALDQTKTVLFLRYMRDYYNFATVKKEYFILCPLIPLQLLDKFSKSKLKRILTTLQAKPWTLLFKETRLKEFCIDMKVPFPINMDVIETWIGENALCKEDGIEERYKVAYTLYNRLIGQGMSGVTAFELRMVDHFGYCNLRALDILTSQVGKVGEHGNISYTTTFIHQDEELRCCADSLNKLRPFLWLADAFYVHETTRLIETQFKIPSEHWVNYASNMQRCNHMQMVTGLPCEVITLETIPKRCRVLSIEGVNGISSEVMCRFLEQIAEGSEPPPVIILFGGDYKYTRFSIFNTLWEAWMDRRLPFERAKVPVAMVEGIVLQRMLNLCSSSVDNIILCSDSEIERKAILGLLGKKCDRFKKGDLVRFGGSMPQRIDRAYMVDVSGVKIGRCPRIAREYVTRDQGKYVGHIDFEKMSIPNLRRKIHGQLPKDMEHAFPTPIADADGFYDIALIYSSEGTCVDAATIEKCKRFCQRIFVMTVALQTGETVDFSTNAALKSLVI
tara:strand:- start:3154 stop:5097 length:1944 start_codon:yes stop_codon:yes gene_type:complete